MVAVVSILLAAASLTQSPVPKASVKAENSQVSVFRNVPTAPSRRGNNHSWVFLVPSSASVGIEGKSHAILCDSRTNNPGFSQMSVSTFG